MSTHDPPSLVPDGDDALHHGWRNASNEQPSPRLDARILTAARESVAAGWRESAGQRRARRVPWRGLAAAAVVAGLAFVLVPMLPRMPTSSYPAESSQVVPTVTEPAAPAPAGAESVVGSAAPPAPDAGIAIDRRSPRPPRPAPPGNVTAQPSGPALVVTQDRAETAPGPRPAPAASSEAFETAQAQRAITAARSTPAAWAEAIAAARASGDLAGAERELRAFRATWPEADAWLPQDLRAWARTVE